MPASCHVTRSAPVERLSPFATRAAFTIVEVLVALMLLGVGLLGMAGSSALTMRTSSDAARERRAVQRAEGRIAWLAAGGCAAAASGSRSDPVARMDERWIVSPSANGVVSLDAQVRWVASGRAGSVLLRGAVLC